MNRRHRLTGRRRFAAVRSRRRPVASGPLRVHAAPNDLDVARIGFVLPRAVGGAVVRNRVRRRLREALRPRLGALAGLDVVVSASRDAADRPLVALAGDLDRCLSGLAMRGSGS